MSGFLRSSARSALRALRSNSAEIRRRRARAQAPPPSQPIIEPDPPPGRRTPEELDRALSAAHAVLATGNSAVLDRRIGQRRSVPVGTLLAGAILSAGSVALARNGRELLLVLGALGFIALVVGFVRLPHVLAAGLLLFLAFQPTLDTLVSGAFGPAKDVAVIAAVLAAGWRLLTGDRPSVPLDAWLVGGVVVLIALYAINAAGSHNAPWFHASRLTVESFALLLVGVTLPDPRRCWRWMCLGVVVGASAIAVWGLIQQRLGVNGLVRLGFEYDNQIRLAPNGQLRSFGTFGDPFNYSSFLVLALTVAVVGLRRIWQVVPVAILLIAGIEASNVRTSLVLVPIVLLFGLFYRRRTAVAAALLAAACIAGTAYLVIERTAPATSVTARESNGSLVTLNGRTSGWEHAFDTPLHAVAGHGVGQVGTGLARAQAAQDRRAKNAPAEKTLQQQQQTSVDSSYVALIDDVGLIGLLIALAVFARILTLARRAGAAGRAQGWIVAGLVLAVAVDSLTRTSLTSFPVGYIALLLIGTALGAALGTTASGRRMLSFGGPPADPMPAGVSPAVRDRVLRSAQATVTKRRPNAVRGTTAALVSRLTARLLGLGLIILLAREVSEQSFAMYSYLLTLAAAVSVITDAGVALVANREIAAGRMTVKQAAAAAAPTQLVTVLFAGVLVLASSLLGKAPGASGWPLYWTTALVVFTGIWNYQCELLRGSARPWTEAGLQMAGAVTQVGLGAALVLTGHGISAVLAVLVLRQVLLIGVAQIWLPVPFGTGTSRRQVLRFLRRGLWLGVAATLATVTWRFGQLVLGNTSTVAEVAVFGVAARYLEIITTFCQTIGLGLLPALSRHAAESRVAFRRDLRRAMWAGFGAASLLACGLVLATPWLTTFVFGERYQAAAGTAQIFVGTLPFVLLMYIAWNALTADQRERWVTAGAGLGAIVALAGCVWIYKVPTAATAGWATAACVGVTCSVLLLGLWATRESRSSKVPTAP